jgi:hypothetical protein
MAVALPQDQFRCNLLNLCHKAEGPAPIPLPGPPVSRITTSDEIFPALKLRHDSTNAGLS